MLSGEYYHTIDAKSRLCLPTKMRDELKDDMVLLKNVDACLSLYPRSTWTLFEQKLSALPDIQSRNIKRFLYSSAVDTVPDSQGRILIPQNLRDYAKLGKDVTVIGVGDHLEIWDREAWSNKLVGDDREEIIGLMIGLGL